ncbi:B12-binding domain-containing radical SAM protein [Leucothrix arctica]|uniref:B12-binding domain-containing radical SAM protein n=1 Tax=Leucothrix arctica TaxID=1481894 RepID=A0A317C6G6_9GAMM|nr:radical SAM protein [Leucothrix arctica]PWQ93897.1 B12-binding domain-containing radical SAM protein [Leucothrix arctica]
MENKTQTSNILFVDLNNFAAYPTLAVGYLIKSLRQAHYNVELLSPLALGVPAFTRDNPETWKDQLMRRLYFSGNPVMRLSRDFLREQLAKRNTKPHPKMLSELDKAIEKKPSAILISAYLDHFEMCKIIGEKAKKQGVPVLLGGPFFNLDRVTKQWLGLEGINAIVGGEVEFELVDIVKDMLAGKDLSDHEGVFTIRQNTEVQPLLPLQQLNRLPAPDFTDFPWQKYPHKIVPIMSGRGCSWGACTFCGDVVSANGRTFRSRGLDAVLDELRVQSNIHSSSDFIFLDIKLNSDLDVWYGLINNMQKTVPGARWIGTVHVNHLGDNGLDRESLFAAKKAGLTRISFGLESGSQVLLDTMKKGTKVEEAGEFLKNAYDAGISVRTSMMQSFPGETAEDLRLTVEFIKKHEKYLDRIRLSRFKPLPDTPFDRIYQKQPDRFPYMKNFKWDYKLARGLYQYYPPRDAEYRKQKNLLLGLVYDINRKTLRDDAKEFNGMM